MRNFIHPMVGIAVFLLACICLALVIVCANFRTQIEQLRQACIPTDTGGGVTQCIQPSMPASLAVRSCFRNAGPYIGRTQEDTFHLLAQCFDDYMDYRAEEAYTK